MCAYPAYTIDMIRDELSWRQVRELMQLWGEYTPGNERLHRIEMILLQANGLEFESNEKAENKSKSMTVEQLQLELSQIGIC